MSPPSMVLNIPELLYDIFQVSDNNSNASNARVCKYWSGIALDVMWCNARIVHLLETLAPLEYVKGGSRIFSRQLEVSDWQRFERYRFRVKTLKYAPGDIHESDVYLDKSVFGEIAKSRTCFDIFPNLHTLKWMHVDVEVCRIFMHGNIRRFTADLTQGDVGPILRDIAMRMPYITHLDLVRHSAMGAIEPDVIILLSCLPNLITLTLPPFYFTEKVAEVLAISRSLKSITLAHPFGVQGFNDSISPRLPEDSYPSLLDFAVIMPYSNIAAFLNARFAPVNLATMCFTSTIIESPADVSELAVAIANKHRHLKSLKLHSNGSARLPVVNKHHCISMDVLRPLCKCWFLTTLHIGHHYPLQLQLVDIVELAESLPNIESLSLNYQSFYADHSNLTLDALLPLARHCPKLCHFGLYFKAIDGSQHIFKPESDPVFRSYLCLKIGLSNIENEDSVAHFLDQICPMGCHILIVLHSSSESPDRARIESREKWWKVNKLLREASSRRKRVKECY